MSRIRCSFGEAQAPLQGGRSHRARLPLAPTRRAALCANCPQWRKAVSSRACTLTGRARGCPAAGSQASPGPRGAGLVSEAREDWGLASRAASRGCSSGGLAVGARPLRLPRARSVVHFPHPLPMPPEKNKIK